MDVIKKSLPPIITGTPPTTIKTLILNYLFPLSHFYKGSSNKSICLRQSSPIIYKQYSTITNNKNTMQNDFIVPSIPPSWNWTPERIMFDANCIIDNTTKLYDQLESIEDPTFENFVKPFMIQENKITPLINQLCFLQHVSSNKSIRDASNEATELLQNFEIEISLRYKTFKQFDKIWQRIKDDKEKYLKDDK